MYQVTKEKLGTYTFTTSHNITYTLALVDYTEKHHMGDSDNPNGRFYFFSLTPDKTPKIFDPRIQKTITVFLHGWLCNNPHAVIYIAAEIDGRAHQRHLKFDRWYERSVEFQQDVERHVRMDDDIQVTLLVHKTNPYKEYILEVFLP